MLRLTATEQHPMEYADNKVLDVAEYISKFLYGRKLDYAYSNPAKHEWHISYTSLHVEMEQLVTENTYMNGTIKIHDMARRCSLYSVTPMELRIFE
jgi:hypothetical protein